MVLLSCCGSISEVFLDLMSLSLTSQAMTSPDLQMELPIPGESHDGLGVPRNIGGPIQSWGKVPMEEYAHLKRHLFFSPFSVFSIPNKVIKHPRQFALSHIPGFETRASWKWW